MRLPEPDFLCQKFLTLSYIRVLRTGIFAKFLRGAADALRE